MLITSNMNDDFDEALPYLLYITCLGVVTSSVLPYLVPGYYRTGTQQYSYTSYKFTAVCFYFLIYKAKICTCCHQMQYWFSGRMRDCHSRDPSSILGYCMLFCYFRFCTYRLPDTWYAITAAVRTYTFFSLWDRPCMCA